MKRDHVPDGASPTGTTDAPQRPSRGGGSARTGRRATRRRFRARWIVALVVLVAVLVPAVTWIRIWYVARLDERPASDAIVVLGASQYNGRPSPIFEARLEHAAALYREGVAPRIVTVGGNQPGDNFTEGGSGHDWLVEVGVPHEQLVALREGKDTLQSVEVVAEEFDQRGWTSAVLVTDPWHSLRSAIMAEDHGIEAAVSPARSGPAVRTRETQLWYITRETASIMHYRVLGGSTDISIDAAQGPPPSPRD